MLSQHLSVSMMAILHAASTKCCIAQFGSEIRLPQPHAPEVVGQERYFVDDAVHV